MIIPFLQLLFQGIPEQIGVVSLAFAIARIPFRWSKIIAIGVFLAVSAYAVRLLPIPFGIHTILLLILLFSTLVGVGKGDFSLSLAASLLSFLTLILLETVSLSVLMPIFHVSTETLLTDPSVRLAISEPQVVLLFLSAFLLNQFIQRKDAKE